MFIIMKTQELVDVRVGESTQPDYGYELSDRCIITKSSNAVASGAGSKGLFSYKSTKLKAIVYTQKTWSRPRQVLCLLLLSL